jgi:hypothetical protein
MIPAYPLSWPAGWKRTNALSRKNGQFKNYGKRITVAIATDRVLDQLYKLGVSRNNVVISTNLQLRMDGFPRGDQAQPADRGAAVYWRKSQDAPTRCMAIDQYARIEDNLAAIAATLEAMRAIERHGGAEILDRAFTGFKALEASNAGPSWWDVLEVDAFASAEQIESSFRRLARSAHPDAPGGSHDRMAMLNAAREQGINAAKGRA